MLFLAQLAYGDPTLSIDRVKSSGSAPPGINNGPLEKAALARYNFILGGGRDLRDMR